MKTSDFDFVLPPDRIAQFPAERRDGSRLMVLNRAAQSVAHRKFPDILEHLRPGDLLVVNNTRVLAARLMGRKPATGGKVELFLLEEKAPGEWEVLMRSRRRPAPGDRIDLDGGAHAVLLADGESGRARVRLESPRPVLELIEEIGLTPLPPYISRASADPAVLASDRERYQTVFARESGAVAAPTAGLHFTPELLAELARRGIGRVEVTLHTGIGTFRPVATEEVEAHTMEAERYIVSDETARRINETRAAGGRIVAVGSTSVRTLEFASDETGRVVPGSGRVALFIVPPYRFKVVDVILTNFHLPRSTLILMMSAFAGREFLLRAYDEAIRDGYRFFSYGDAMLIE